MWIIRFKLVCEEQFVPDSSRTMTSTDSKSFQPLDILAFYSSRAPKCWFLLLLPPRCIFEVPLCRWPEQLWAETSWKPTLWIFFWLLLKSKVAFLTFFFFFKAKELLLFLSSANSRHCVSCHPVLIWTLMYFINKELLSSLTVVTPWFQCRMRVAQGYNINNQHAAITPF